MIDAPLRIRVPVNSPLVPALEAMQGKTLTPEEFAKRIDELFDKKGAKIGSSIRIRYPIGSTGLADTRPLQPMTIAQIARLHELNASRDLSQMIFRTNEFLNYAGPLPPRKVPTPWERFRAPFLEAKWRLKNAWLALKGHPIESDDY